MAFEAACLAGKATTVDYFAKYRHTYRYILRERPLHSERPPPPHKTKSGLNSKILRTPGAFFFRCFFGAPPGGTLIGAAQEGGARCTRQASPVVCPLFLSTRSDILGSHEGLCYCSRVCCMCATKSRPRPGGGAFRPWVFYLLSWKIPPLPLRTPPGRYFHLKMMIAAPLGRSRRMLR